MTDDVSHAGGAVLPLLQLASSLEALEVVTAGCSLVSGVALCALHLAEGRDVHVGPLGVAEQLVPLGYLII
jgi:hypothetical protein